MSTTSGGAESFEPTLGDLDLYLLGVGRHEHLWTVLGAHPRTLSGVAGTSFAVWAPAARRVGVTGDFTDWDASGSALRRLGASGVWECFVPGVEVGDRYKFVVEGADGVTRLKADPMAFAAELAPANASVVTRSTHRWHDDEWLQARATADATAPAMSVYEVHLGSWRRNPTPGRPDGLPLGYRELGEQLATYCTELGFTHVELLPVAEHPFGGSWGYQVTGYYAPTARYGTPDDFRAFVDILHRAGIGVLLDWVPGHFPRDDWALARFDGSALYEHADPRQGEHPDWGTLVFNLGRTEVRNFLVANASYWCEEFHVDGLRVDAVASMLYLDYSRAPGGWVPNRLGGRENLEAIDFLAEVNAVVHARHPGVLTIAEESTAWPGVTHPVDDGGLGFDAKWNMGWMHDTLEYFGHDPVHRSHHQSELTFGLAYAWTERFVLALSHDEVVHEKRSLLTKMPGDGWQRLANLRALYGWMWAHPGRKLLFMGGEIAQPGEWNQDRSLDWHLLSAAAHAGVQRLVGDLNRLLAGTRALRADQDSAAGFAWVAADDTAASVLSFLRLDPTGGAAPVLCVANLTPVPRRGYRIGVPHGERWRELLCTDAERYGGSGVHASGPGVDPDLGVTVASDPVPMHGHPRSLELTLPPLGVLWLTPGDR